MSFHSLFCNFICFYYIRFEIKKIAFHSRRTKTGKKREKKWIIILTLHLIWLPFTIPWYNDGSWTKAEQCCRGRRTGAPLTKSFTDPGKVRQTRRVWEKPQFTDYNFSQGRLRININFYCKHKQESFWKSAFAIKCGGVHLVTRWRPLSKISL